MEGDSELKPKDTLDCNEQPESAKPDPTRWYVTGYRPLPIAASSTPVEPFLERPIKATQTFGESSSASADFHRLANLRRGASWSGSSNPADGESTIPNTPRENHSRFLFSTPELGRQPTAGKRWRVSSPRPSGMSKIAEN